jgi:hypothetical protein
LKCISLVFDTPLNSFRSPSKVLTGVIQLIILLISLHKTQ